MDKVVASRPEAVPDVPGGPSIAVGGFGVSGIPWVLITALLEQGAKGLTVVSNNCGVDGAGLGVLLAQGRIDGSIASYIGENKEFTRQFLGGELEVEADAAGHAGRAAAGGRCWHRCLLHTEGDRHARRRGRPALEHDDAGNVVVASPSKEVREFELSGRLREFVSDARGVPDGVVARADGGPGSALGLTDGEYVNLAIGLPTFIAGHLPPRVHVVLQRRAHPSTCTASSSPAGLRRCARPSTPP